MQIELSREQALQFGLLVCKHCGYPPNNHFDHGPKKCAHDPKCPGYGETARVGKIITPPNIYIVGMNQTGGCWMASGKYYSSFEDAEKEVKQDRANGIDYTKVFPLEPAPERTPEHLCAYADSQHRRDDGTCRGGVISKGKCGRCGATLPTEAT